MKGMESKNLKSLLKGFLILICFVFMTACAPSKPAPAPVPQEKPPVEQPKSNLSEYLPLQEGNSWKYEGIGNEFASYTQEVTHRKANKAQVVVSSGTATVNRYEITEDSILNTYRLPEFYEKVSILDRPSNIQAIILKLPLEVGNSWVSESNSCEIIDLAATVETPSGVYRDCLAIKTTYQDSNHSINYYAKGIGMVKSEYVMSDFTVISQLSSYSVQAPKNI